MNSSKRRYFIGSLSMLMVGLLLWGVQCDSEAVVQKGHLVIIGGGKRPDSIMEKIVELGGASKARIVIVPNASSQPFETARYQQKQFQALGPESVEYILCTRATVDADSNLQKLADATVVFFSGGDQRRLTRDLLNTQLLEEIRTVYQRGGVISGTSAGAAVMSRIMITGDEWINEDSDRAFSSIMPGNIAHTEGFAFVSNAIIDQHFIKRRRNNRLISLVLENPDLIGIGIDESTAIVVKPDDIFTVLGVNTVLIYDARQANAISTDEVGNFSATNIQMHLLQFGQSFDIRKGIPIK